MRYRSKYKSKKVTHNGMTFDSKKEYTRWLYLSDLANKNIISDLQRQVKYVLIPTQREPDTVGKCGGKVKGKLIERECSYYADFVYIKDGKRIVEDTKGFKTTEYKIKRKLMLYIHGIRIQEI